MLPKIRVWPHRALLPAIGLTGLILAGCATGAPANDQLGAARAAIDDAQRVGAAESAPAEINTARAKLAQAEEAARRNDHQQALWLAEQAQIDAQLAASKAQSASAQEALRQVRQSIQTLQEELEAASPE